MDNSTVHYIVNMTVIFVLLVGASVAIWLLLDTSTVLKIAANGIAVLVIPFAGHRLVPRTVGRCVERFFPTKRTSEGD